MNFEQGKKYELEVSDSSMLTLRYDGLGRHMQPVWTELATGATIHTLPPFVSYCKID